MKNMISLFGMLLLVVVAASQAQNPASGQKPPSSAAGIGTPFQYTAEIRFREIIAGRSNDWGTVFIPIAGRDSPATFKMKTGKLEISAECTVFPHPDGSPLLAEVPLTLIHDGIPVTRPTARLVVGGTARFFIGDFDSQRSIEIEVSVFNR